MSASAADSNGYWPKQGLIEKSLEFTGQHVFAVGPARENLGINGPVDYAIVNNVMAHRDTQGNQLAASVDGAAAPGLEITYAPGKYVDLHLMRLSEAKYLEVCAAIYESWWVGISQWAETAFLARVGPQGSERAPCKTILFFLLDHLDRAHGIHSHAHIKIPSIVYTEHTRGGYWWVQFDEPRVLWSLKELEARLHAGTADVFRRLGIAELTVEPKTGRLIDATLDPKLVELACRRTQDINHYIRTRGLPDTPVARQIAARRTANEYAPWQTTDLTRVLRRGNLLAASLGMERFQEKPLRPRPEANPREGLIEAVRTLKREQGSFTSSDLRAEAYREAARRGIDPTLMLAEVNVRGERVLERQGLLREELRRRTATEERQEKGPKAEAREAPGHKHKKSGPGGPDEKQQTAREARKEEQHRHTSNGHTGQHGGPGHQADRARRGQKAGASWGPEGATDHHKAFKGGAPRSEAADGGSREKDPHRRTQTLRDEMNRVARECRARYGAERVFRADVAHQWYRAWAAARLAGREAAKAVQKTVESARDKARDLKFKVTRTVHNVDNIRRFAAKLDRPSRQQARSEAWKTMRSTPGNWHRKAEAGQARYNFVRSDYTRLRKGHVLAVTEAHRANPADLSKVVSRAERVRATVVLTHRTELTTRELREAVQYARKHNLRCVVAGDQHQQARRRQQENPNQQQRRN